MKQAHATRYSLATLLLLVAIVWLLLPLGTLAVSTWKSLYLAEDNLTGDERMQIELERRLSAFEAWPPPISNRPPHVERRLKAMEDKPESMLGSP